MSGKVFYTISFSFLSGVFVAPLFQSAHMSFCVVVYGGVCCLALGASFLFPQWKYFLWMCSLCGCVMCLGTIRYLSYGASGHSLDASIDSQISIRGYVCSEPEARDFDQRFCFQPYDENDRILVRAARFPRRSYGEHLEITGNLEVPENFSTYENGPEFDYVSYLQKDSIRYVMSRPRITVESGRSGYAIVSFLIFTKSSFTHAIEQVLPEPAASLVEGILLGDKGVLPQDISDNFRRSGLTHILVLSGSNVTVVAESLLKAFSFLPRMYGQMMGAGSIILFAIMTGASTTTMRATIMALIGLYARATGRRYDVSRALAFSAIVMVGQNPQILRADVSFQLSFLATIAVIYVSPICKRLLWRVPERFGIRETLAMTIGVQIFTLPFIIYDMGEISVIALVPNLLVLPTVPAAMLLGFLSGLCGMVWRPLAVPCAWATRVLISYAVYIVDTFGSLDFATAKARLSAPLLGISYVLLVILTIRLQNSFQRSAN